MLVRFLTATDYQPTQSDTARCWGQLRYRPTNEQVPHVEGDEFKMPDTGPMVTYFRKGATPDLPDDIAMGFIAAGVAERYDGPEIKVLSHDETMLAMQEETAKAN